MRSKKSDLSFQVLIVLFIFALLIIAVFGNISLTSNRKQHIEQWATNRNWRATKIEQCFFNLGPYWHLDNEEYDVYRAEISDEKERPKLIWFAFGTFHSYNTEENQ